MSAIPTKVRKIVAKRDEGRCLRCGGQGSELHHRQRRRDAGHPVCILVTLCSDCHRWVHSHPEMANVHGFIIPPWDDLTHATPLKTYAGWVVFDNQGEVAYV